MLSTALLGGFPAARAEFWDAANWRFSPVLQGEAGYDSNVEGVSGGTEDWVAMIGPGFSVSRSGTRTKLELTSVLEISRFFESGRSFNDPTVRVVYAYPFTDSQIPWQEAEAGWVAKTEADPDAGGLVNREDRYAWWEGRVFDTGKTRLRTRGSFVRSDHEEPVNSSNDTWVLGATVAVSPQSLMEIGGGYDLTLGKVRAEGLPGTELRRTEHALSLRGRGRFTPRIEGRWQAGIVHADYSEVVQPKRWDWTAGIELDWTAPSEMEVGLRLTRASYFSSTGDAVRRFDATVEVRRRFIQDYTVRLHGGVSEASYWREVITRKDNAIVYGAALERPLGRSGSGSLELSNRQQDSDVARFDFDRLQVTLRLVHRW